MFNINIDLSDLLGLKQIEQVAKDACEQAAKDLSKMCHAKAIEIASEKLHTRRQMFIESLDLYEEGGVHVLSLAGKARWIDDGLPAGSMIDSLLSSPKAKLSADGSRYLVVPFDHSPGHGATNTTPAGLDLVNEIKGEMKKKKIPWAKIERDDQGRPKLGRLHKFNIEDRPIKTHTGPGQGKGPLGAPRQGPTGIPFLRGVAVYQNQTPKGVKRSVMTFRVVSSKHQGTGRWERPQLEPTNIFQETYDWAQQQLEDVIAPKLVADIVSKL